MKTCENCGTLLYGRQQRFCSKNCTRVFIGKNRTFWTPTITQEMHEILEGFLLSDGHLYLGKTHKYPSLHMGQMANKVEYVRYFADLFDLSQDRVKLRIMKHKKLNKEYPAYFLKTKSTPIFKSYYDRWYPSGTKIIPEDFKITPLSLLHAYIGDGTIYSYIANKNTNPRLYWKITLYFMNFDKDQIENIITKQLNDIGINSTIRLKKYKGYDRLYPTLDIGKKKDIINFLEYVSPNPIDCYNYKFSSLNKIKNENNCIIV
jgi:hypothetical protein